MNRLVLTIAALFGLVFGGSTIIAALHGLEYPVMAAMIIGIGFISALAAPAAPLRNGFAAGFLMLLLAVWLQAAFLPLYFENNPEYATTEIPFGLTPRIWTFLFAPLGAVVAGFVAALLAWLASYAVRALGR